MRSIETDSYKDCSYCGLIIRPGQLMTLNGKPIHIGCMSLWVKDKEQELLEHSRFEGEGGSAHE